jgi:hypothetical protein
LLDKGVTDLWGLWFEVSRSWGLRCLRRVVATIHEKKSLNKRPATCSVIFT